MSPDIRPTSWLSRVTVSTVRRQRYAQTTEETRDLEVAGSRRRRRRTMFGAEHDGQRSNGRSAGAREAPRVLHRQLDRTPHVLHHLRDVVVHQHVSISMFVCTSSASPLWHIVEKRLLFTHHVSTFLFFDHLVVLSHLWNVQLAPAREQKYSFSFNSYYKNTSRCF